MHFGAASFFVGGLCFRATCILGLPLFLSEVSVIEPHMFWVCLFFHWRSLLSSPLCFGVASFFVGGLCFRAHCVLGLPLFRWRSLFLSPLHFGAAYFFIGGLCYRDNDRGFIICLLLWLYLSKHNSRLSNTKLAWLAISTA
jgi:hypothetical protein